MFLLLAVDVSLGLVGGSAAEDARGSQGDVMNHLGPHDDYLGATIVRVADSVLVGGRVGLSGTSRDVVGDDGVAGGKKVNYFCCNCSPGAEDGSLLAFVVLPFLAASWAQSGQHEHGW